MPNTNAAYKYDLNKYRNLKVDKNSEEYRQISIKKKAADKGAVLKISLISVATLILLFCVIYGKVEINKLYNDINLTKHDIDMLECENIRMKTELESTASMKNIEEYAENVLNLVKLDKSQVIYFKVENENVIEIPEKDNNIFVTVKDFFTNLFKYVSD